MLDDLKQGIDPDNKADPNLTLQGGLDSYLASRHDLRPASVRAYRQIERWLSPWLNNPLRLITPDMVEKKHREIAAKIGPTSANACMRTLRIVLNHAAERVPDLPVNPVRRLKRQWYKEKRRTRMLSASKCRFSIVRFAGWRTRSRAIIFYC